jgi:hypothetical protein
MLSQALTTGIMRYRLGFTLQDLGKPPGQAAISAVR